jgi:hypothetical protein
VQGAYDANHELDGLPVVPLFAGLKNGARQIFGQGSRFDFAKRSGAMII